MQFVQVGAADGLRNDLIREFVVRDHWAGVFIEPISPVFDLLKQNYCHINCSDLSFLNAAVSLKVGATLLLWSFSHEAIALLSVEEQLDLLQKTSTDKSHVLPWALRYSLDPHEAMTEIQVPCTTCNAVIEEFIPNGAIDILAIDAEGHEPAVLQSLDFGQYRPEVILFESHNLDDPASTNLLLESHAYILLLAGGDTIALDSKSRRIDELRTALQFEKSSKPPF